VLRTLADCAGTGAADAYAVACGTLGLPALAAGAVAVGHDGVVELDELEMLRLIGAALDCPLPPLAGKTA